jgi:putative ATP-dependent endonuclease of OLD family
MKILKLAIENFRSYKKETITFTNFNCFIGANSSGKSTVINALNLFFRENKNSQTNLLKLTEDDFHHKNTDTPIKITVTFGDLSNEAKSDLAAYIRQNELTITAEATFDEITGFANVKQYGQRKVISEFSPWFVASKTGKKVSELLGIYSLIKSDSKFSSLPSIKTKGGMEDALREFEEANSTLCSYMQSEDQFYGATKGANRLAPHIQWVFIPATKDISTEAEETKNSALSILLDRTVRAKVKFDDDISKIYEDAKTAYKTMLDAQQAVLSTVSSSIESRLQVWSKPDIKAKVKWNYDDQKTIKVEEPAAQVLIGDNGFEGELARCGHGMQRSYIFALLQELVGMDDNVSPTLLMAIEEPELYQHPPQMKYLADTLFKLSNEKSQIILCSHSPYFVPSDDISSLRIVRESGYPSESVVSQISYEDISDMLNTVISKPTNPSALVAKVSPALSPVLNEMFFSQKIIFVEGIEDVAILTSYLHLMGRYDEFRRQGCHIVPVHGKSEILRPLCIAQLLKIPVFVLIDGDANKQAEYDLIKTDTDKTKKAGFILSEITKHKNDNASILSLCGQSIILNWPTEEHVFLPNITMWKNNITQTLKLELGTEWKTHQNLASEKYGLAKDLTKNPLAVAYALESAWQANLRSPSLMKMINIMLGYSYETIEASDSIQSENAENTTQ